jgi:hypothetical protein
MTTKSELDDIRDEIVRLTGIWMEYVGYDHHKDRDCHWFIKETYSYGEPPVWIVEHYGYIGAEVDIECATYEAALRALRRALKQEISSAQAWARERLAHPEDGSWWADEKGCAEFLLSVDVA